jgi:hypothetical protein
VLLKLLANLYDEKEGQWSDRALSVLTRLTPAV